MRPRASVPRRRLVDCDVESADDEGPVDRIAAGDARAFGVLMRRHDAVVRRTIMRITRNAADTEDVRQETALKVWQHLRTLEDRRRVRARIPRIAGREALRLLAGRHQDDALQDDVALVAGPDLRIDRVDLRDALGIVLDSMPAHRGCESPRAARAPPSGPAPFADHVHCSRPFRRRFDPSSGARRSGGLGT